MRSTVLIIALAALMAAPILAQHSRGGAGKSFHGSKGEEAAAPQDDSKKHPGLFDPSKAAEKAPEVFKAKFETTKGDVVVEVKRAWSPNGADRFYNLVKIGFFDDTAFFRVIRRPRPFMVQTGISGDPRISRAWQRATIKDEPTKVSNQRGYVTFAKTNMPNSRTTQIFFNYGDNSFLDRQGFAPFGKVVKGMEVLDKLYADYGEQASNQQSAIQTKGNPFLAKSFPKLDYTKHATIIEAKAEKKSEKKPADEDEQKDEKSEQK